ncbi:MAG: STAS domain-containing protein [Desulforegulaceae bacterium]|jgi:anti-anti-sigma regulatory factor|nr:STAS domain-containing protein [Desulforegulaceae bacterium]
MGFKTDFKDNELVLCLTGEFTIYDVSQAKKEILKYINNISRVKIKSDELIRADTAGIQLVISLVKTCIKNDIEIIMKKNSKIFEFASFPGNNLKTFLYERVKDHA